MSETVFSPFSFKSDAVIIDNGEYPTHSIPLQWISDAKFTVCCDGAADTYLKQGKVPDVIIGDGDSISQENAELYRDIIHHVKDQETNDQTKAVNYLLSLDKHNIVIVAATGRREDHTLGNISLLIDYAKQGANIIMATDYGFFMTCRHHISLSTHVGQQISVFSFGASDFHSEGLVYPLPHDLTNWWQGTLNEANSDVIRISADGYFLVFQEY